MSVQPEISADHLMRQAASTADFYFGEAVKACKARLGKAEPVVIAAFIQACTVDFDNAIQQQQFERKQMFPHHVLVERRVPPVFTDPS